MIDQPRPRIGLIIFAVTLCLSCWCGFAVIWFFGDRILGRGPVAPEDTLTPPPVQEPRITSTPAQLPTPIPLPIRENFSQPYSDLWQEIGQPFVTERNQFTQYGFSGVLTVPKGEMGGIRIGNIAWTNYTVLTSFVLYNQDSQVTIGLRVKDLNNYIAFECDWSGYCDWVVISEGVPDRIIEYLPMRTLNMIINVDGDTFSIIGDSGSNAPTSTSLTLPPKYQGKFSGGGVMILMKSQPDVDYVEIQPFP